MSTTSQLPEVLRRVLEHPTGGVAGLVDDLLVVCQEHGLEIDWQAGCCRVRSFGGDWQELTDLPLRKSVFRAILARVAALCNERAPNSVSPYGGHGELSPRANPAAVFRVAFVNTPTIQRLELTAAAPPPARTVAQDAAPQADRQHSEEDHAAAPAPGLPRDRMDSTSGN
jgi:hypothetical protein